MVFEVWDAESRNLLGAYQTVDKALTELCLSHEHSDAGAGLLLRAVAEDGASMTIAEGDALKQLGVHHLPER